MASAKRGHPKSIHGMASMHGMTSAQSMAWPQRRAAQVNTRHGLSEARPPQVNPRHSLNARHGLNARHALSKEPPPQVKAQHALNARHRLNTRHRLPWRPPHTTPLPWAFATEVRWASCPSTAGRRGETPGTRSNRAQKQPPPRSTAGRSTTAWRWLLASAR